MVVQQRLGADIIDIATSARDHDRPGTAAIRAAAVLAGTAKPTSSIRLAAYEQAAKIRKTLR